MAEPHDRSALEAGLRAHLQYLRDLGIDDLYRRALYRREATPVLASLDPAVGATPQPLPEAEPGVNATPQEIPQQPNMQKDTSPSNPPATPLADLENDGEEDTEDPNIAARKPPLQHVVFTPGPRIAAKARAQVLEALRAEIGDCTRCPLGFAGRHSIVFGDGDPNARLLFVGEGPGADEDAQGVPFVGRAGQLLNNMITAMGLARSEVYIANIVKCRPPANRMPEPVEAITCSQFLFRQIDIVRPHVIVALGATAATYLLGGKSPLSALRGRIHDAFGAKLIVTYHPAYLLRDPRQKKEAWADLQIAMAELKG
jgi:DNA polymerase